MFKLCKRMQTPILFTGTFSISRKDYEHFCCHVRNLSCVFRMPLKILSGCLHSEENDKQSYHDIPLTVMTPHNYFSCYNEISLLCFATLSTKHIYCIWLRAWITSNNIAFCSLNAVYIFFSYLSAVQYTEASWWHNDVRCMPYNHKPCLGLLLCVTPSYTGRQK